MKLHAVVQSLGLALILAAPLACGDDTATGGGGSNPGGGSPGGSDQGGENVGAGTPDGGNGGENVGAGTEGGGGAGEGGIASGGGGAGEGGAGGGTANASDQIAAVLATADGAGLNLPIQGGFVTYTKPAIGADAGGFFLQAEQAGPAIFVINDPLVVDVGDEIDLTVTEVATTAGLKHAAAFTGLVEVSTGFDVAPLVSDINAATDLVTNLDGYAARVISFDAQIDAAFINAGNPQVAAEISTTGLDDANLRMRMPEAVRATFDLQAGCLVTVDYGVMWRFNGVAQASVVNASDITDVVCDDPTVVSAIATSNTTVVVTFDRDIDAASVGAADFTFDQGLTATAASAVGKNVTVTTSTQVGGLTYTVTAAGLTDVLGAPVGIPDDATFPSFVVGATMLINEVSPNIGSGRDLVELVVTGAGSTNGITLSQVGSAVDLLATFPDVNVAVGDLIVVHLTPLTATGAAPSSELTSKSQFAAATFSANYDNAWDFHGGTTGITFSNRVLRVEAPGSILLDAVPFVLSNVAMAPAAFPAVLQALQAAGDWLPLDCGGMLCTYVSTPTAVAISVDYLGVGNTAAGNSVARNVGVNGMMASDWDLAAAQSFGLANP